MDDFDDACSDCCTQCGKVLTVFDTIIRISRAKRPTRPERVYCSDDWKIIRDRFTRRFDRTHTSQMVRIYVDQYSMYELPAAFPKLPA